jgi:acyl-CoA synthetase (AMP-forming)/AMP-acid ligase II
MSFTPPETLLSLLAYRAKKNAGRPLFSFLGTSFSYRELWEGIERFGAFLSAQKMGPGDRVVLALPNGPEFFIGFYGTQLAGGIAVPLFPESGPERIFSIASLCGAKWVTVPSIMPKKLGHDFRQHALRTSKSVISVKDAKAGSAWRHPPKLRPEDTAFIQYTSGSTGNPKGVCITHSGILLNIRQMVEGMEITKDDIFVSWLPVHHDMGLILMTMVPFYVEATCLLLPSSLMNIRRWIETIDRVGGTFTAAPDFAYRWALVYIKHPGKYDLSRLRVALNAAEPVRAKTISEFNGVFGLQDAMMPAYGLAEATVGVSCWPPGRPVKSDDRGFVSVGRAFPGIEIGILRKEELAGPRVRGEIVVRSPANTPGYFGNPSETSRLYWKDGYIRTGDLGYLDEDGDLFVVGREKNIIIQSGQNISPQEVEETVDGLPFVRLSAAVGIDKGGVDGEQVYIFAEIKAPAAACLEEFRTMSAEIVQTFLFRMGYRPGRVYLLRPRSIPRTLNGKVKYAHLRSCYQDGSLRREGRILFPDY